MMKRNSCMKSLHVARLCRDIVGDRYSAEEQHIRRHMANLEAIGTYGGANDIHALVVGKGITGIEGFRRT